MMDRLEERLQALPAEAEPAGDGWPVIEGRLRPRGAGRRWTRAAAAALIFAAGATGGFLAKGAATPERSDALDEALVLAAEVQRTGTEYVAALAAFGAVVDSLSADARAQGRDAALAALFGAAAELAALDGTTAGVMVPIATSDPVPVRF